MNRLCVKKWISLLLGILLIVLAPGMRSFAAEPWPSEIGTLSETSCVMDFDSGTVLYGQNMHDRKAPASITKILTALVVLEHCQLDERVTYSHNAVYNVESGSGNKYYMDEGDELSVEDALYLLLLASSNQSANALAEHTAGSVEAFADMMNEKCAELGCKDSHFANPSGLNDDTQLTTAYDMALIARAAYSNEKLLEIGSTKKHFIDETIHNPNGVAVKMEHKLLITEDPASETFYPYAVAGKTGYTSIAGQTLVTYAVNANRRLIAVTMHSTMKTHYSDTIALLNFGFLEFKNVPVTEMEQDILEGTEPVDLGGTLYEPSDLSLEKGAVMTIPSSYTTADVTREVLTGEEMPEGAPEGAAAYIRYSCNDRKVGGTWVISQKLLIGEPETEEETVPETEPVIEEAPGIMETIVQKLGEGWQALKSAVSGARLPWQAVAAFSGATALVVTALVAAFFLRRKEHRLEQERKERLARRKQRLEELGVSEEEFNHMVEEKMKTEEPAEKQESEAEAEKPAEAESTSDAEPADAAEDVPSEAGAADVKSADAEEVPAEVESATDAGDAEKAVPAGAASVAEEANPVAENARPVAEDAHPVAEDRRERPAVFGVASPVQAGRPADSGDSEDSDASAEGDDDVVIEDIE